MEGAYVNKMHMHITGVVSPITSLGNCFSEDGRP